VLRIFSHYVCTRLLALVALEAFMLSQCVAWGYSLSLGDAATVPLSNEMARALTTVIFSAVMLLVMAGMGLYELDACSGRSSVFGRLIVAALIGVTLTSLLATVLPLPRMPVHALGIGALGAVCASWLMRRVLVRWVSASSFKARVLVFGAGSGAAFARLTQRHASHVVIGYVDDQQAPGPLPFARLRPADGESLLDLAARYNVNHIVVAVKDRRGGALPVQELLRCRVKGIRVSELATFFERERRQVLIESLTPGWMVFGEGFRQGLTRTIVKRLFDIAASVALLVLTLPVMLVTALCILIESGRPVFYRQERVGEGGRTFTIYKFRSMSTAAERDGKPRWAEARDARVTPIGRVIRKLRIDELPQIFNVLHGEMSFVGPRPERPYFVEQLTEQIPYYALRHSVKPGITGWAQVRYTYGASVDDAVEKLQYDLYYVKNNTLFLDLMILISTMEVVLWGGGSGATPQRIDSGPAPTAIIPIAVAANSTGYTAAGAQREPREASHCEESLP
jgi:sugar transferase (PEP-CTERM system associated)